MRAARWIGVGGAVVLGACFEGRFMLHEACRSDADCVDYACVEGFCGGPPPASESSTGAPESCGDGAVDPGEACDGPQDDPATRCVACQIATCPKGYHLVPEAFCAEGAADAASCLITCVPDTCGDGLQSSYEDCDDANADNSDACLATCVEAECGDGFVHAGSELCDDGNQQNGDSCDQRCTLPSCGDGAVQAPEECDDGNVQDGDACRNVCVAARCGDGVVQQGVEDCDKGADAQDDSCSQSCEAGVCGDGVVQVGVEECDDGDADDADLCVAGCKEARCGDGFVQFGVEACDEGPDNGGAVCDADCVLVSCGDGMLQPGEVCDDGDADNTDECLDNCLAATCGDGYEQEAEACDLGVFNLAVGCVEGCSRLTPIVAAATGPFTSCVIVEGGGLRCWGRNVECQLGLGNQAAVGDDEFPAVAPALELGERPVVQVVLGRDHSCALFADASVRCWGGNDVGQLGYGDAVSRGCEPATRPGLLPALQIWEGDEQTVKLVAGQVHTCALSNLGRVRCWGFNYYGPLGYPGALVVGVQEVPAAAPVVEVGGTAVDLFASHHTTCAIVDDGAVRCWGGNFWGSLGIGSYEAVGDDEAPASVGEVALPAAAATLAVGSAHTCALLTTDELYCWGSSLAGELGLGDLNPFGYATPQLVPIGAPIAELGLGAALTCVRGADGAVRCWGTGKEGQLANGTGEDFGLLSSAAAAPAIDFGAPLAGVALSVNNGHTCALLEDGALRCWGASGEGQTGAGQTANIGDNPEELPLYTPVLMFPP
jgi:cysteine-rich repeat protein